MIEQTTQVTDDRTDDVMVTDDRIQMIATMQMIMQMAEYYR